MWLGVIAVVSMFGEYIVSREVNGFIQLLGFVGMVGLILYVGNETLNILFKTKN
jgi:hypothetical protein